MITYAVYLVIIWSVKRYCIYYGWKQAEAYLWERIRYHRLDKTAYNYLYDQLKLFFQLTLD